ncbi:hypothetical protein PFISCL1PPCAC_6928, partial [Pristionchus fissidentatus]
LPSHFPSSLSPPLLEATLSPPSLLLLPSGAPSMPSPSEPSTSADFPPPSTVSPAYRTRQAESEAEETTTVLRPPYYVNHRLSFATRSLLIMNVILLSSIRTSLASVRCFNTETGNSIAGADYHRVRGVDHRSCAIECRDDPSCLAFEYNVKNKLCFLKSRSLSGALQKNEDTMVGFCLDEDDEMRDRFYNHEIDGPIAHEEKDIEGEECRALCLSQDKATIYSWIPSDIEDDDSSVGTCKCIESIKSITLNFNTYSGFLPQKRQKFRF